MNWLRVLLFVVFPLLTWAQHEGLPFVRNFGPEEYKAEPQVWAATQDYRGWMYFGSTRGVLEYDGLYWRSIPLPNDNTVRSLDASQPGQLYVGAVGDFGQLVPDSTGKLYYQSLCSNTEQVLPDFADVWYTKAHSDGAFFCTEQHIFFYHSRTRTTSLLASVSHILGLFRVEGRLLVSVYREGIFELSSSGLKALPATQALRRSTVWSILPHSAGRYLLYTGNRGLMLYWPQAPDSAQLLTIDGLDAEASSATDSLLAHNQFYHAVALHDSTYAFATVRDGIFLVDKQGRTQRHLNKQHGLRNNTVHHLFQDANAGMWASTAYGISYIEVGSPISFWTEQQGLLGAIYHVARHGKALYVSTNLGVSLFQNGSFVPVRGLSGQQAQQVFQLRSFSFAGDAATSLLAAGTEGSYELQGADSRFLSPYFGFELYPSRHTNGRVYMGYNNELVHIDARNGRWWPGDTLASFDETPGAFEEDAKGNLWMVLHKLPCYLPAGQSRVVWPDSAALLRAGLEFNDIEWQGNALLFLTNRGLWRFTDGHFQPDTSWTAAYANKGVLQFLPVGPQRIWVNYKQAGSNRLDLLQWSHGRWWRDSTHLARLPGFDWVVPDGDSLLWVVSPNRLFQVRVLSVQSLPALLAPGIRRVVADASRVLHDGAFPCAASPTNYCTQQDSLLVPTLAYEHNSLLFEFALPAYEDPSRILFSYALQEDEGELRWSAWSPESKKEYTNLWEGTYRFYVRAQDVHGRVSQVASYAFRISPPWYRRRVVFAAYFVLAALLLWGIVRQAGLRMQRENERLEGIIHERTAEITEQKEEIQSQALVLQQANDTLSQKNEEINKQKSEIEAIVDSLQEANLRISEQNKLITDSIRYAQRIQQAVLPDLSLLRSLFADAFILYRPRDIVSGDFYFMKNLGTKALVAVADCTGHGVPGAFMSMLSIALLNEIVRKQEITETGAILEELRRQVKEALHQNIIESSQKDGLDLAMCLIDRESGLVHYSGANIPLYLVRDGQLQVFAPTKSPIGIYLIERPFETVQIQLQSKDMLYMSSDGYTDQFGGKRAGKLKLPRFRDILLQAHQLPCAAQQAFLEERIDAWMGDNSQIDDMLVLGLRF